MGQFYVANEYWFAVFQLVMAMLGMGATLKIKDFRGVIVEPFPVSVGTAIQLGAVPLLAFGFIALCDLSPGVAIGVALISAVPGGSSSNIFTHFARGNVALSISVTALTTLACLVTTPYVLELLISTYLPDSFVMPTLQIMKEIALNLLLPLALGMVCLRLFPVVARVLSTWCIRASILGLIMIFAGSAIAGRLDTEQFGMTNVALVSFFIAAMVVIGWSIPKLMGLNQADSTAIEMEVVVRNINLGLMLKVSLFPVVLGGDNSLGDTVLFTLLLYGAVQLMLGVVLIPLRKYQPLAKI